MSNFYRLIDYLDRNASLWPELLRIYLGIALFTKGVYFMGHMDTVLGLLEVGRVPFASLLLAHYIALAHVGGGLLLTLGLLTRAAALVQVPVLVGALVFVQMRAGMLMINQGVDLAAFVLVGLLVFSLRGARRLSVDSWLERAAAAHAHAANLQPVRVESKPRSPFLAG